MKKGLETERESSSDILRVSLGVLSTIPERDKSHKKTVDGR